LIVFGLAIRECSKRCSEFRPDYIEDT